MISESSLGSPIPENADPARSSLFAERSPALSVLVAFSLGILADTYLNLSLPDWLYSACMAALLWGILFNRQWNTAAAVTLLGLIVCLGGIRYHVFWSCQGPEQITRVLENMKKSVGSTKLIRVSGIINSPPQTKIPDDREQFDPARPQQRTNLVLTCQELISGEKRLTVSGNILVTVFDSVEKLLSAKFAVGDTIDVCGELKHFTEKHNPQDYDFELHFRKRQIGAILNVKSSEAIRVISKADRISWNSVRQKMHDTVKQTILDHTSGQSQAVALALLLGDRSGLKPAIRQKFSRSGLIHFLAISGLHIGFFSLFVWSLCHLLNLPRSLTVGLLILAIGLYLSVIEIRPPVLRAATFCVLGVLGLIHWRTITTLNLVCLSALIILLINPTDLFDPGTQLSFLAVAAILWTVQQDFYQNPFAQSWVPLRWRILAGDPTLQTPLQWFLIRYFRLLYSVFLVTLFIWIVTAPLVIYYFNLLAPIGLIVNTLIFPFLFLILLLGYLFIFAGPFLPFGCVLLGALFEGSLTLLLLFVEWMSQVPGAHYQLPAPSFWWLVGYYLLILCAVAPVRLPALHCVSFALRRTRLPAVPAWVLGGLLIPLAIPAPPALTCTFIAVNHGVAILIEMPEGQTVLYDAGSMSPVSQTYEKIRKTLLNQRIRRVDLLLLSHADRDHFNAASELVENCYVRSIAFPKAFLNHRQQGTQALCDLAGKHQLPIKIIGKGDRLNLGGEVQFQVLHPGFADEYEQDNSASLTVLISYRGRQILLTGDLDGEGLTKVLAERSPAPIDVLLSPHHGSLPSNTVALSRWSDPAYLIVSGGKEQTIPDLAKVYRETRIYTTNQHGAITCRISRDGNLSVEPYHAVSEDQHRL